MQPTIVVLLFSIKTNPSNFYGTRSLPQDASSPGHSYEETYDVLSADDGDSTFSKMESCSSPSSSFDTQDTMDDTAIDELTNDDNNQPATPNNIKDSSVSWSNVYVSQRLYLFTIKEKLVI